MALVLQGIDAGYGLTPVLRGVTLTVSDGAAVALLGPNGAGKSTLMRVIAGLLTPTAGRVTFDDIDIGRWDTQRRAAAGICLIPEGRGIFPTLTVRENLVLQARKGTERESIERATDAFPRLKERLGQRSGTLSGGEQQMLALARAYVRQPKVVLLDEVSFGPRPGDRRRDLRVPAATGGRGNIPPDRRAVRRPCPGAGRHGPSPPEG